MKALKIAAVFCLLLFGVSLVFAQDDNTTIEEPVQILPASHQLFIPGYEAQGWNNCGPATLTSALSFFGYTDNQTRAANWLKPTRTDANVSPWQMTQFVNSQVPEIPVYALQRNGGDIDMLKLLIANDFPVIIEEGYDPPGLNEGWMGHYLLIKGYDDGSQVFTTNDSYSGEGLNYSYEHIKEFWQHFNYTYIVLYESGREPELLALLGDDANEQQNFLNALTRARDEAVANPTDAWAWFNMGTNLVALGEYERAAIAYDEAFKLGMPWRTLWYQFGPYEAYNAVGRFEDTIQYARTTLDNGGENIEETFYYAGIAREGIGEFDRAADNYRGALGVNPNFEPARERLNALTGSTG